jgi:phosphoglycerate dehydrogenase-like enzyme
MEKPNIAVTYNAIPEQQALLLEVLGDVASLTFLTELAPIKREQALEEATILLSWNFPSEIQPQEYSRLRRVLFIQLLSAGADHTPFADLPPRIIVASNPGAYAAPMAEHVLAMTLALVKHLLIQQQKLKEGEFDQFTQNRMLSGMTAGILGYGGIGRATARLMRAFGMRIYAIDTSGTSPEPADFLGTLRDLEEVLRESDVVVICLPLTQTTRGLIGEQELAWMKPDAILVNVARGALLDEEALYTHVKSHPNFLLGIDAWWNEPFLYGQFHMEYPFLELPNVLGSPHNSGVVLGILIAATRQAAENVNRFLKGEQVVGIARREDYV